ncbi:hypothetical protein E2P81_ATG05800 [Venturia nashicola]|nr:hypothetical protein E2P81_ATG05800 [Venturia nashicola]
MLGSFTALIIFSLSTAAINSLKDAIRKTSVQMESEVTLQASNSVHSPVEIKIPFVAAVREMGNIAPSRTTPRCLIVGVKTRLERAIQITRQAASPQSLRKAYFALFTRTRVNTTIHDLRCLKREGTRHGIYTNTGDCRAFSPFEKSWDNKVQSYRCIIRLEE